MPLPKAQLLHAPENPLLILWNGWYWTRDPARLLDNLPDQYDPLGSEIVLQNQLDRITGIRNIDSKGRIIPLIPSTLELVQHALNMLREHVPIPELITLVWGLENVPRALQEQIVRTRNAAFFCETHRVVDKSSYADDGDFFPLDFGEEVQHEYMRAINMGQEAYRCLKVLGVPPELARGVLPMHVNSRLIMGITLREFARQMSTRTCEIAQSSYWKPLIDSMRPEMEGYLGKELSDSIFEPSCAKDLTCIMPGEAEARLRGESPYEPCTRYTGPVRENFNKRNDCSD